MNLCTMKNDTNDYIKNDFFFNQKENAPQKSATTFCIV